MLMSSLKIKPCKKALFPKQHLKDKSWHEVIESGFNVVSEIWNVTHLLLMWDFFDDSSQKSQQTVDAAWVAKCPTTMRSTGCLCFSSGCRWWSALSPAAALPKYGGPNLSGIFICNSPERSLSSMFLLISSTSRGERERETRFNCCVLFR